MNAKSDAFGRLLKGAINSIATYEGKTAPIIEDELGQQIGIAGVTIQRYKSGKVPPETRTVKILAESAVKRGFLGREWLQRFLHAARYPGTQDLVDELCPEPTARPRPARIYHNLPAPTYSQFIMREQAFADILDGLRQRSASVLVVGLGGNGKTSLAREVSAYCLAHHDDAPHFDAVVWISDKGREGTTNLSLVLDEIARTLDYPGFTQYAYDEKQYEIEQLLRRQKVLLVLDNFETITDGILMAWLLRLPEPSKAIITTRERHRTMWGSWLIELRGMTDPEAQELIQERLRVLKMHPLVSTPAQFEPLIAVTGGNPKAITIALGLLKHERQPIQQVVDDLYAARGNLFDDLFTRAWALLDDAARRVLLVMPFFMGSASSEALAATADVHGFAFDRAVERLIDVSLLDVLHTDLHTPARYALHPLVQVFAQAKIAEQTDFEASARERWVQWYVELTAKVGFCWNDMNKLNLLDYEQESAYSVANWAINNRQYEHAFQISKSTFYYYFIRGDWSNLLVVLSIYDQSAAQLNQQSNQIEALTWKVFIFSRRGNVVETDKNLQVLLALKASSDDELFLQHLARFFYYMAQNQYVNAELILQEYVDKVSVLSDRNRLNVYIWLGICLYQQGKILDAQYYFQLGIRFSIEFNAELNVYFIQIFLSKIEVEQNNLNKAEELLNTVIKQVTLLQDKDSNVLAQQTFARIYTLRGDIPAARIALTEAIDLFERMGMQRELAEAREELAKLNALETIAN